MPAPLSSREKSVRRVFDRLGSERLLAFFRAIQSEHGPLAAKLVNDDLNAGSTLEEIFFTAEPEGFYVDVKGRGRRFQIEFGYMGHGVGDGGTWEVEFDAAGQVTLGEGVEFWIS